MTAAKDTMRSWPDELLMILAAAKEAGIKVDIKLPETYEQEFERLIQTQDAIEY